MARGGLIEVVNASFEKDGKQIDFRKVRITRAGREPGAAAGARIPEEMESEPRPRRRKKGTKTTSAGRAGKTKAPGAAPIEAALKAWRLAEARKKGIPAFRVLTDKAIQTIVAKQPRTNAELLGIAGVGLATVDKYGAQIFRILSGGQAPY
jgi:superfamily II DNA helicase RecQ